MSQSSKRKAAARASEIHSEIMRNVDQLLRLRVHPADEFKLQAHTMNIREFVTELEKKSEANRRAATKEIAA